MRKEGFFTSFSLQSSICWSPGGKQQSDRCPCHRWWISKSWKTSITSITSITRPCLSGMWSDRCSDRCDRWRPNCVLHRVVLGPASCSIDFSI